MFINKIGGLIHNQNMFKSNSREDKKNIQDKNDEKNIKKFKI